MALLATQRENKGSYKRAQWDDRFKKAITGVILGTRVEVNTVELITWTQLSNELMK